MPNKIETLTLIANRVPPSDRWRLVIDGENGKIYLSITEALNAYYEQATVKPQAYRLESMNGKLYAIKDTLEPEPEPKKYSIYGDYTI